MARLRLAVIAYDDVKESSDVYFDAFQAMFAEDEDIQFTQHWGTIQDAINFIHDEGNAIMNELDRIIVLDQAFEQQVSATKMTEEFVTLEQVFNNNHISHPYLAWLTINQEAYDVCKTNQTPKGQEILCYDRVRITRLVSDRNGGIENNSLIEGIDGTSDKSSLTIRRDFTNREERTFNALKKRMAQAKDKGEATNHLDNIGATLRKRYGIKEGDLDKKKNKNKNQDKQNEILKSYNEVKEKEDNLLNRIKEDKLKDEPQVNTQQSELQNEEKTLFTDEFRNNALLQIKDSMKTLFEQTDLNLQTKYGSDKTTLKILVGGRKGSGVSSIVANLAECFACFNKKTLIINVSDDDMVTRSFKHFQEGYQNGNRKQVLISQTKEINNKGKYIPVTSMIDIISDVDKFQSNYTENQRIKNLLHFIFHDGKEHSIILIDAGEDIFNCINKIGNVNLNSIIFVSDNNIQHLQELQYLGHTKQQFVGKLLTDFQNVPLNLIINKSDNRDFINKNVLMNETNLNKFITNLPAPFDRLYLLGKIPYYKEWNLQNIIQQRACYFNDEIFEVMKNIAEGMVFNK